MKANRDMIKMHFVPTKDQLVRLVNASKNLEFRTLLALVCSTGARKSELLTATTTDGLHETTKPVLITVVDSRKEHTQYRPLFITKETRPLIGELVKPLGGPAKKHLLFHDLTSKKADALLMTLKAKAFRDEADREALEGLTFHSMRRYVRATLRDNMLNEDTVNWYMGWQIVDPHHEKRPPTLKEAAEIFKKQIEPVLTFGFKPWKEKKV